MFVLSRTSWFVNLDSIYHFLSTYLGYSCHYAEQNIPGVTRGPTSHPVDKYKDSAHSSPVNRIVFPQVFFLQHIP